MKRGYLYAMLLSIPVLLLLVAFQAGRYSALAAEARKLEEVQDSWVQENRKLEAGILILSSRERAAASAESLGLKKAGPERSLRIVVRPQPQQAQPIQSSPQAVPSQRPAGGQHE
jgi:hypothetical protein